MIKLYYFAHYSINYQTIQLTLLLNLILVPNPHDTEKLTHWTHYPTDCVMCRCLCTNVLENWPQNTLCTHYNLLNSQANVHKLTLLNICVWLYSLTQQSVTVSFHAEPNCGPALLNAVILALELGVIQNAWLIRSTAKTKSQPSALKTSNRKSCMCEADRVNWISCTMEEATRAASLLHSIALRAYFN